MQDGHKMEEEVEGGGVRWSQYVDKRERWRRRRRRRRRRMAR